ncbi:BON domain-containing protein, partial [Candidatus Thorarchaeota archaeon]
WDDRIDGSQIDVKVKGNKVILRGSVPDYDGRKAAEISTFAVYGVHDVENKLTVKFPEGYSPPKDEEIQAHIQDSLDKNVTIDKTDLEIIIQNGHVTLEGDVDSYWKKERVEQIASGIGGVVDVTNNIAIVPTDDVIDEEIAEGIVEALRRDTTTIAEDIDVEVRDGIVILRGEVPGWVSYSSAVNIAKRTAGVKGVKDDIKIETI